MTDARLLSRTVEKLYAAAVDADLWREALMAVEDFTGSTGAVVDLIPLEETVRPRTFSGSFSEEDCTEYAVQYQAICPRIAFAVRHPEIATQFDSLVLSEAEMDRDPVYEWFGKHGLRYYVAGHAGRTRFYQAFFSLQRSRRQGHVDTEDIARFELIRPHLAQALAIADTLGTLTAHRRFSEAMLDALPQAIFGLANDGALLFTNASAERLLARGACLSCKAGRLMLADTSQQHAFDLLLADALSGRPLRGGGRLLIRRAGGGQPYAVRLSRVVMSEMERLVRPTVIVVVNDPESAAALDQDTLSALYALTPCETRLAATLLQGHSIQSASHALGSSTETLRSHLKSIFRKVGVSRQQDLVRMLAELEMSSIAGPGDGSNDVRITPQ